MTTLSLMLLLGSILSITIVQLCTAWLRRWAGAGIAYTCWLLPWLGVIASMLAAKAISTIIVGPIALTGLLTAPTVVRASRILEAPTCRFALLAWAAGAILFFFTHLAAYRAFVRNSVCHAVERGRSGTVRIFSGPNVSTPVAAGIIRPCIFLPADFDTTFSLDEQRMILRHEQAHHKRNDIVANFAGLLMLSLHWWNPLAYRAHRRFRADQELACDATAIADLGRMERHAYGMAILKCAGGSRVGLVSAMSGRSEAAARLSAIAADIPPTHAPTLPTILVIALFGSLVFAEGAATRAFTDLPILVTAATQSVPMPSFSKSSGPAVLCENAWLFTPETPLLARYHPADAFGVHLIVARIGTSCIDGGYTRAA